MLVTPFRPVKGEFAFLLMEGWIGYTTPLSKSPRRSQ
jgi:hypothetical protein